jgi:hypothetical protein
MLSVPLHRVAVAAVGLIAVPLLGAPASAMPVPGPIHAGNTYGWYPVANRYEFVGPLGPDWKTHGDVGTQNGMLTLLSGRHGNVSATLRGSGHDRGRWEIRWRGEQYGGGHTAYRLQTALVPVAAADRHCGAQDVTFEDQRAGHNRARFSIHALPDVSHQTTVRPRGQSFTRDHWHTFAVEVTPKRISWFVDARVVATETRPAALSGVPLTVRFRLAATKGATMNRARMQMDWLRYWTLRKPDSRSTAAPHPHTVVNRSAC